MCAGWEKNGQPKTKERHKRERRERHSGSVGQQHITEENMRTHAPHRDRQAKTLASRGPAGSRRHRVLPASGRFNTGGAKKQTKKRAARRCGFSHSREAMLISAVARCYASMTFCLPSHTASLVMALEWCAYLGPTSSLSSRCTSALEKPVIMHELYTSTARSSSGAPSSFSR